MTQDYLREYNYNISATDLQQRFLGLSMSKIIEMVESEGITLPKDFQIVLRRRDKIAFKNEKSPAGDFVWTNYAQPVEKCPFYYTIANGHFIPQVKYTHDSSNNQIVDFIGKFETLQEDYDKLNKICDWNFKFMTL